MRTRVARRGGASLASAVLVLLLAAACAAPALAPAEEGASARGGQQDASAAVRESASQGAGSEALPGAEERLAREAGEKAPSRGESLSAEGGEGAAAATEGDGDATAAADGTVPDAVKTPLPTLEKTVSLNGGPYGKTVVASTWDQLGYRIDVRLPETLDEFDRYPLAIEDVLPDGVGYDDARGVSLLVGTGEGDSGMKPLKQGWMASWAPESRTLAIEVADAIAAGMEGGQVLSLRYFAYLNKDAGCGAAHPNTNTAKAAYLAQPGDGEMDETVPSVAHAHTFSVEVGKRGPEGEVLSGAQFELRDVSGSAVAALETDEEGQAVVAGIGPGTYKLVETRAPAGYGLAAESSISIESEPAASGGPSLTAAVEGPARLLDADAASGRVSVEIVDSTEGRAPTPVVASQSVSSGLQAASQPEPAASTAASAASSGKPTASASSGSLPQTGDDGLATVLGAVLLAAIGIVAAVAARRRAMRAPGRTAIRSTWEWK